MSHSVYGNLRNPFKQLFLVNGFQRINKVDLFRGRQYAPATQAKQLPVPDPAHHGGRGGEGQEGVPLRPAVLALRGRQDLAPLLHAQARLPGGARYGFYVIRV